MSVEEKIKQIIKDAQPRRRAPLLIPQGAQPLLQVVPALHAVVVRARQGQAAFVEDLGADSLDLTELIMAMEEEFGVEIADEDAQKILKVKDAISYIESKQK